MNTEKKTGKKSSNSENTEYTVKCLLELKFLNIHHPIGSVTIKCVENGEVESIIKFQHEIDPHLFRETVHSRISSSTNRP
jgi:hypothetical protein